MGDGGSQPWQWFRRGAQVRSAELQQLLALISEIWMLVDFVAGNPLLGLSQVKVVDFDRADASTPVVALLGKVTAIQSRVEQGNAEPGDRPLLEAVRDALNITVRPASGLTVAYTTMVSGPLRNRGASRYGLAVAAYPNLVRRAFYHRSFQTAMLLGALFITLVTSWESAKVALGKALMQNLEVLRVQQVALNNEKLKLELKLAGTPASSLTKNLDTPSVDPSEAREAEFPVSAYRVCDRPVILMARTSRRGTPDELAKQAAAIPPYATAEERDLCGRDYILAINLGLVRQDLRTYLRDWPDMVGSAFSLVRNVAEQIMPPRRTGTRPSEAQHDVEFLISPVLLVWGNFVLPILFSFMGTSIFVMLDHYKKVQQSRLDPRDFALSQVRAALGLVVGACVGLFFSASGPSPLTASEPSATALISSLTLTASGVAFLAGFGVETVFTMLEGVLSRVFSSGTPAK